MNDNAYAVFLCLLPDEHGVQAVHGFDEVLVLESNLDRAYHTDTSREKDRSAKVTTTATSNGCNQKDNDNSNSNSKRQAGSDNGRLQKYCMVTE